MRALLAMAMLCSAALAQTSNVPTIAQDEIARRGNHVEQTGTIRSGLMAAALSPPADDSAKWFLTLLVKPGEPASDRLQTIIANDPAMRPWVDARDPMKSATHYQVRSVNDATQADWLRGLRPALENMGTPLVVLQPPKNGQFGPSATIVKLIRPTSGEDLSRRLRDGIVAYVQSIDVRGISEQSIGVQPPFVVPVGPQPQPQPQPQVPIDFPLVAPTQPTNPSEPAPESPSPWLAVLRIVGMYVAGWYSARLKSLLGAKLADFTTALAVLKQSQKDPPA